MRRRQILRGGAAVALTAHACGTESFDAIVPPARSKALEIVTSLPETLDLTRAGTVDWMHFGLAGRTHVERKAGGSTLGMLGSVDLASFDGAPVAITWSDGAPTPAVASTRTAVQIAGTNATLSIGASTRPELQTLSLLVGGTRGRVRIRVGFDDRPQDVIEDVMGLDSIAAGPLARILRVAFQTETVARRLLVQLTIVASEDSSDGGVDAATAPDGGVGGGNGTLWLAAVWVA